MAVGKAAADIVGVRQFVGILIFAGGEFKRRLRLMRVPGFDEFQIVVVAVVAVTQMQAQRELMRLGDFLLRFGVAAAFGEGITLARAVRALERDGDLLRRPGVGVMVSVMMRMVVQRSQAKPGRHAVLNDFQLHLAVAGIDNMRIVMVMIMMMRMLALLAPGAPQHPRGNADNHEGRGQLEIPFIGFQIPIAAEIHAAQRDGPHHGSVR